MARLFAVLCLAWVLQPDANAQGHFEDCVARTGSNATLVIPGTATIQVNGAALDIGDRLAVVTGEGLCAGAISWTGQNTAFPVWGDDILTAEVNGFSLNEPLSFRIWDVSENAQYDASNSSIKVILASDRPFLKSDARYAPDAIYVLSLLSVSLANPTH